MLFYDEALKQWSSGWWIANLVLSIAGVAIGGLGVWYIYKFFEWLIFGSCGKKPKGRSMKTIKLGYFQVSIPKKYKVKKHSAYIMNKLFFTILRFTKIEPGLSKFIKKNPPDLKSLKGFHSYEIKMGEHSFIFYAELGSKEPEDLADLIQSQTKHRPVLADFQIKGYHGKTHGSYSKEFTWIDWWLKKGNCLICFNIQGPGMPSDEVKSDISDIFENLKCIDET